MEKQRNPKPARPSKGPTQGPTHKKMHPETVIPPDEPRQRADILPATHVDDDPESFRLT